jgi:hypothetical protein
VDAWFAPDRIWPADWSSLQLYITADTAIGNELTQLVAACDEVFVQYPHACGPRTLAAHHRTAH